MPKESAKGYATNLTMYLNDKSLKNTFTSHAKN